MKLTKLAMSSLIVATTFATSRLFGFEVQNLNAQLNRGNYGWVAKENGSLDQFAPGINGQINFGLIEEPIERGSVDNSDVRADLPAFFDLRNVQGVNWLPPVRNQGKCGSCVAFAALSAMEGTLNVSTGMPQLNINLSEQDLFGDIGSCDRGSQLSFAANSLKRRGVSDEACFRYVSGRLGKDASAAGVCLDRALRKNMILSSKYLSSRDAIKTAVMKGPVMTSMTVYEDFMFYQAGVYKHVTGSRLGGHAIAIVGWNDGEQAWIVRNSWGPDWGEEGYFRIAYDDASGLGESAISFVVESPSAMAHVTNPVNFRPVRGIANVNVHGLVPNDASGFKIEMKKVGVDFAPPTLVIDMPSNSAAYDFSQMSDGLYEIKSSILKADGVVGKPGYSHIIVANQDKNFSVEAVPDFDATKPVKDRVYVKIQSNTLDIPLTHAELIISDIGGSVVKKVRVEDPGAQTMVSWRTQTFANGPYVIHAKGFVGQFQEFTSAPLSVTVGKRFALVVVEVSGFGIIF